MRVTIRCSSVYASRLEELAHSFMPFILNQAQVYGNKLREHCNQLQVEVYPKALEGETLSSLATVEVVIDGDYALQIIFSDSPLMESLLADLSIMNYLQRQAQRHFRNVVQDLKVEQINILGEQLAIA